MSICISVSIYLYISSQKHIKQLCSVLYKIRYSPSLDDIILPTSKKYFTNLQLLPSSR